jgi:Tfp pilus assembly ATPase PilU
MQTLDQNLTDLVRRNIISPAEARSKAKFRELPDKPPSGCRFPRGTTPCRPLLGCLSGPANFGCSRNDHGTRSGHKFINDLLKLMVSRNGGDLFITAEFPPAIKIDGKSPVAQPLTAAHAGPGALHHERQAGGGVRADQGCNFAISPAGIGRFRVNAFMQQGKVGMVLRTIPPPSHD